MAHRYYFCAFLLGSIVAVSAACGSEPPNTRSGAGRAGSTLGTGNASAGNVNGGSGYANHGIDSTGMGNGSGAAHAGNGAGNIGNGTGKIGPSGAGNGSGRGSAGDDAQNGGGAERMEGVVHSIDDLIPETYDVGKSGNTLDFGGSGGTLDMGAGGTLDTGSGGTIDMGTGGTIDTCIPTCTPDILGVGEKAVNLVVFKDAAAQGCDTEGRMWVGGNAQLDGYGVGMQLTNCDKTDPVLVVGGNLELGSGGINGKMWVGGEYSGSQPVCGTISNDKPGPVDFAFIEAQLIAYSKLLGNYPAKGETSDKYGTVTFTGSDKDMNIFTVSGEALAASNGITIDVPKTSTVIVNVTGTSAGFNGGAAKLPDGTTCGSGAVKLNDFCNRIVWNMPNAKTVSVSGTAVQGTILAPGASLKGGGANVNGTVIVKQLEIEGCVEMHPHYFNGCLCTEEVNSPFACCPK